MRVSKAVTLSWGEGWGRNSRGGKGVGEEGWMGGWEARLDKVEVFDCGCVWMVCMVCMVCVCV